VPSQIGGGTVEESRLVSYNSPQKHEAALKKLAAHKRSPGVDFTGGRKNKGPRMKTSKSSGKDPKKRREHRRQTHSLDFYNASGVKGGSSSQKRLPQSAQFSRENTT
jgi:hypothetical protein